MAEMSNKNANVGGDLIRQEAKSYFYQPFLDYFPITPGP